MTDVLTGLILLIWVVLVLLGTGEAGSGRRGT
jgi:hypothetical protein